MLSNPKASWLIVIGVNDAIIAYNAAFQFSIKSYVSFVWLAISPCSTEMIECYMCVNNTEAHCPISTKQFSPDTMTASPLLTSLNTHLICFTKGSMDLSIMRFSNDLYIVYKHVTFDYLCATWWNGQPYKTHVRFNIWKASYTWLLHHSCLLQSIN